MPAGAVVGARTPGVRLPETNVAFACLCPRGVETGVAFAGEKWVYFVRFSVEEVLSVSMVAVEGRAVVMAVSRWPASAAAVVSLVSKPPCHCALCAKKFALRHRVAVKVRKSSPCMPKTAEKRCFQARWASFFADVPVEGWCWANFFAGESETARCWANSFASTRAPRSRRRRDALHVGSGGHDTTPSHSVLPACRPLMSCNSPTGSTCA